MLTLCLLVSSRFDQLCWILMGHARFPSRCGVARHAFQCLHKGLKRIKDWLRRIIIEGFLLTLSFSRSVVLGAAIDSVTGQIFLLDENFLRFRLRAAMAVRPERANRCQEVSQEGRDLSIGNPPVVVCRKWVPAPRWVCVGVPTLLVADRELNSGTTTADASPTPW